MLAVLKLILQTSKKRFIPMIIFPASLLDSPLGIDPNDFNLFRWEGECLFGIIRCHSLLSPSQLMWWNLKNLFLSIMDSNKRNLDSLLIDRIKSTVKGFFMKWFERFIYKSGSALDLTASFLGYWLHALNGCGGEKSWSEVWWVESECSIWSWSL